MAKFYQLVEHEDAIRLLVPARQRIAIIAVFPLLIGIIGFGVLWWGYQSLSSQAVWRQAVSEVSATVLLLIEAILIRTLLLEIAVTWLTFERTTIGVKRSILGIAIAQHWYSCYRLQYFQITHDVHRTYSVRVELKTTQAESILLAANMPTDSFVRPGHLLRRRQFAYLQED